MNPVASALCDALMVLEDQIKANIVFAGGTYPCVGGGVIGGKLLGQGGSRTTAQGTIIVRTAVFPAGATLPSEKKTLSYTSAEGAAAKTLRIDGVTPFQGAILVLECNDPNQGA